METLLCYNCITIIIFFINSTCESGKFNCSGYNCTGICEDDEFVCGNGDCVAQEYVCDGTVDCQDSTDETNCSMLSYLLLKIYICIIWKPFSMQIKQVNYGFKFLVTITHIIQCKTFQTNTRKKYGKALFPTVVLLPNIVAFVRFKLFFYIF